MVEYAFLSFVKSLAHLILASYSTVHASKVRSASNAGIFSRVRKVWMIEEPAGSPLLLHLLPQGVLTHNMKKACRPWAVRFTITINLHAGFEIGGEVKAGMTLGK